MFDPCLGLLIIWLSNLLTMHVFLNTVGISHSAIIFRKCYIYISLILACKYSNLNQCEYTQYVGLLEVHDTRHMYIRYYFNILIPDAMVSYICNISK